jgi:hypothetical protein
MTCGHQTARFIKSKNDRKGQQGVIRLLILNDGNRTNIVVIYFINFNDALPPEEASFDNYRH